MTSRKGRKTWAGELPVETRNAIKKEAKETGKPQWQVVDQAVRLALGLDEGSTEAALERQLEEHREEAEDFKEKAEEFSSKAEDRLENIDRLQEQLEEIRESKASYREQLDEVLDSLLENPNTTVMAYSSEIQQAAIDEYGRDTKDNISRVVADLHDRRDKRDLQLEDHRFKRSSMNVSTNQSATADGGNNTPNLRILSDEDGDSE
ncbi:hypothetical protein [Natronosalvus halobius]|uniref:hypothetical protein n=1 Tax=Natronosalvus halobius TaxID=2953746 RepID=UPI0020A15F6F|nr:hypothetical protein [Natronosalvus halobius]USZ73739.1 hypothetical protein NGM15_18555 [Natronosalvus halobius]